MINPGDAGDGSVMRGAFLRLGWSFAPSEQARADARVRSAVQAHFELVWRTLVRLGVARGDADDGAQQVFLVLSERLADVPPERERAFLLGAAVRIAARHRRTVSRRHEVGAPVPLDWPDAAPTPDEALQRAQARRQLDDVLDALPHELRAVFVLHELEEQTMAEIAQALELPPGTVASRLRRARAQFSERAHALGATP